MPNQKGYADYSTTSPATSPDAKPRWGLSLTNKVTGERVDVTIASARQARKRRRLRAWSRVLPSGRGIRTVFITLTYAAGVEWSPNHIRDFLVMYRRLAARRGAVIHAYAWVAEMQVRGAVHYHLVFVVSGWLPRPDTVWRHGFTRIEQARSVLGYLMSYCGKEYQQHGLPKGARAFAVWVNDGVGERALWAYRLSAYPRWLEVVVLQGTPADGLPRRAQGGGWLWKGERWRSPWIVKVVPLPC